MITSIFALIVLYQLAKFIIKKIKSISTDIKNENNVNYWMFTYDFKTEKKESIFDRDPVDLIKKRKTKNNLIVLLYITTAAIFIYFNLLVTQILKLILG
tara:strand:+ start:34257 stop:34553 length:297 start_codon:yes stop_codon:yes gene_type:complete